mgnify:CR=1 FL=1
MKILVTGGAGYIGSHIVLSLCDSGYEVIVLDDLSTGSQDAIDNRAQFILGSTLSKEDTNKALNGVDGVIHLAAFKAAGESMLFPSKYSQNNIGGTINLINSMIDHDIKIFIFSSTAAVYGYPEYLPIDEKHPLNPINFYGFTKLEIERILHWYNNLTGLKYAALRYFNAAGYDKKGRINHLEKNPPKIMEKFDGKFGELVDSPILKSPKKGWCQHLADKPVLIGSIGVAPSLQASGVAPSLGRQGHHSMVV